MALDDLLIVGAGPAGLSLSLHYPGASRILEAGDEVGGLCRSLEFGGAVFDIGGHSFHSPHSEVTVLVERLMAGRWNTQRRDARVWFGGELIDYPFQAHYDQLSDAGVVDDCRRHAPEPGRATTAANFEDWIVERFGAGVARHFMLPYNRKLWARDLRRMSREWVGERVAGSVDAAPKAGAPSRQPLQTESTVSYPADGGFAEIFKAMAKEAGPIEFGRRVVAIDPSARRLRTATGGVYDWRRLASTMPLPLLLEAIDGCPAELVALARSLEFVSLKVLMLAVDRPLEGQPQRVYVANAEAPPHKIAFNHTSSPALRSRPAHGIMAEIAYSPEKPLAGSDAALAEQTIAWLARAGLIGSAAEVGEWRMVDLPFGYPVYTPERPVILARIRDYLEPLGIYSFGRFGGWDYVNSDACIWQGARLAERLAAL